MNEASPSPISSPEPKFETKSKQTEKDNKTNGTNDFINMNQLSNTTNSSSSSSEKQTLSDIKTTDDNEKMLVEKDGMFKLMSPEEYTAYEKQKQAEKQAALINSKIPHPPTRPKTSIPTTGNRNNSLKNRFISSSNQNMQLPVRYSQSADPNGRRKELTKK